MPDNSLTWVNITAAARGVDTVQRFRDYRRAMEVHSRGLGEALMTPIIFFTFDFPMGNAGFFTPQKYWAAFPMWSKFEALYPGDVFLPLHNLPPADYTGDFDSRRRDLFCDEDEHRTYTARVPAGPWNIYERPIRPEAVRVRSETVETFAKLVVHELNVVYTAPKRSFIMYLAEHHDKWREYMRSILQLESVVADEGRPHDMVVITGGAFADKWAVTVGDVPEGMEPDTNSADLGEKMGLKDYVDSVNNARYCWHGLVFVRYFKVLDRKTYKKYGKMPANRRTVMDNVLEYILDSNSSVDYAVTGHDDIDRYLEVAATRPETAHLIDDKTTYPRLAELLGKELKPPVETAKLPGLIFRDVVGFLPYVHVIVPDPHDKYFRPPTPPGTEKTRRNRPPQMRKRSLSMS